jgi:hypothetical protein
MRCVLDHLLPQFLYLVYTTTSIVSAIHIPDKLMFLICLLPVESKNNKCSIINIHGMIWIAGGEAAGAAFLVSALVVVYFVTLLFLVQKSLHILSFIEFGGFVN